MRALQSCWIGCLMVWAALAAGAVGVAQEAPPRNALAPEKLEFFESKVRPILVQRCYECHSGQESNGGLRLDYREGLLKGGDSGPALQADEPQGSLLLRAIRYQNADLQMPPSGKLDASEIEVLETWVAQGAFDPRADLPSGSSGKPQGMSIQDGRNFWSMMPLKPVEVPRAVDADWCRNPIDAFVLKELDSNGLRPSPESPRREILRRVTLGLIGLVPESQEYKAFEQDTAPEAYERQVDRLLSSEQYGVRFGRHWLDVARYSDSNGLDENIAYGNAWRYRDYVVEAFNSDKPFDRFIEEQIAGDLLPDADRQSKTATGFLVLGAKVLAEPDRDKLTMDTIDEQLDTIGKAFMGMTLGCARCHDHKFDPIKQRDYYALAAILKGTKTFGDSNFGAIKHWNEISYANPQEKEQLKAIDAQIAEKNGAWNKLKSEAIGKLREQVRKQAADYLAVASKLTSEATLNEWAQVGEELKLHPRVLANSRRYLDNHRQEPLFAKWHELAGHGDHQAIRDYYQELFERALGEWEKAKAADAQVKKLEDSTLEAARVALGDVGGFLAIPAKMEHALDQESLVKIHELAESARLFESAAPDETSVMGVADKGVVDGLAIHIRGSYRNLGDVVPRGFPEVMVSQGATPIFSRHSSGRLELARWLANATHPLTARVIVNRVWRWHFGRGLVESTENFGVLGDRPSHPELLDYLARWFIESGWSIKELNRLILTSATYRMSSVHPEAQSALAIDPENRLRWHYKLERLGAEPLRDSILQVAGRLDCQLGGKSVPLRNRQFVFDHTSIDHTKYDSIRRTVYLPIIRNHLYSLLEQFDFPDPTMPVGSRNTSMVSVQMLLLMNADWIIDSASLLARRSQEFSSEPSRRIDWLFETVLGRAPKEHEQRRFLDAISAGQASGEDPWVTLAHNLLICSEFIYVP
ncbi:MAG: PSD1 and planctomycete cytochrome C domain-containing protein [Planctomycetota bacterium]